MGQFVIKLLLKTHLQVASTFFKQNNLSQWLFISVIKELTLTFFVTCVSPGRGTVCSGLP